MPEFIKHFFGNPWALRQEAGAEGGEGGGEMGGAEGEGASTEQGFNWRGRLGNDLQEDPTISLFKDDEAGLGNLAKSYRDLRKTMGNRIPRPDPDNPDAMAEIYSALGRPEDPAGYDLDRALADLELPEGFDPKADGLFESLRPVFHEAGLSDAQVARLSRAVTERNVGQYNEAMAAATEAKANATEVLREEWGGEFDKNVKGVNQVFDRFTQGWSEQAKRMFLSMAGNDPEVIKSFHEFGVAVAEDGAFAGERQRTTEVSPTEAKRRLAEINSQMSDAKSPLMNRNHPKHEQALKERAELYALAYPEGE